ncbi:unnamed protein product [Adineta steineri]|uniref:Tektin n=1 Tax=Adineta steineri TaxID=433720 RepID=A0A818Y9X5_9BILA|nr:unnamed protein product [Adineta steineri]CAF1139066.1 unnamed protein product [Adineta steineri]CAF3750281.1 unnamed protein product [Adineta steineri]CAF4017647.1 unnamed protein product [Adineta steineri]
MLSTENYEFDPSYRGQTGTSIGVSTVGFRTNKYNPNEWHENNYAKYYQAFNDREDSEKQRWQATRTENETLALQHQTQALSTKKLQQRLHDVNFWKFELNRMIEDVRSETDLLVAQKKRLENALDATEAPLHIATESLANRDRRYGEDRVYDPVEIALLKEVEIINNVQNLLRQTIMTAEQQIRANRNAKQNLEMDWSNKWEASVADAKATNRRNEDVDIMFYPGVARHYDNQSTPESWAQNSHDNIVNGQNQLMASIQLRSLIDSILVDTSRDMREQADVVETEFGKRIAEMSDALQKMTYNMRETLKAVAETEKKIDMLRASIRAKEAPLKVAQTRLNDRRARPGIESCHDPAQDHVIGEVYQLSQSIDSLTGELREAESNLKKLRDDHQVLVKEIEMKKNSLYIDQQKTMPIRMRYPSVQRLLGYNA